MNLGVKVPAHKFFARFACGNSRRVPRVTSAMCSFCELESQSRPRRVPPRLRPANCELETERERGKIEREGSERESEREVRERRERERERDIVS